MNKKFAMSVLGYAIVLVIILGVVMIISAPMMADKFKNKGEEPSKTQSDIEHSRSADERDYQDKSYSEEDYSNTRNVSEDIYEEVRILERRVNAKVDSLDARQREMFEKMNNTSSVSNKYVCTIEGSLDANNNVVPIDNSTDIRNQKFVFVCEYRQ